jgi:energy-converting hydrogenase Eha subunit E
MERNTNRWNGEKHRQMKWRATPTDEMERNTSSPFHLSVFLSISSVGVSLHFICRCSSPFHLSVFLSISSVGVSLHFICWCFSPFHLSVFCSISSVGVSLHFI